MLAKLGPNSSTGDLPGYVRKSFKGSIRFIELPRGTRIFTLSQRRGLENPKGRDRGQVTQWWSPYKRFKGDPGYKARRELGASTTASLVDVFLDSGAYANERAGLRYVVIAQLMVPAWAAFGKIRRQSGAASAATGGPLTGYQFYIPGLDANGDIRRVGAVDLIDKNSRENAAVEAAAGPAA
ncbi:MAG: hypothetical protein RIB45_10890 [Marivibrio sp.]|uniref:hypothetical protein n=1 Tax=Marivibrio sp. TaxID=2039719 RepID=UPI0032ECD9CE